MDPSQIQEDKGNDVHSLESGDAPNSGTIDATGAADGNSLKSAGSAPKAPVGPPKKASAVSKLWKRFNLYLLLFILVVVMAIFGFVYLTVKSKPTNQNTKTQGLSDDVLKQLANSDVSVGDAKQVLSVQSNAIFAGSVLVRSSQEIAGTLKVGGKVSLASLEVSGATQLADTQVTNLTVNGSLNLQGSLTIKNGINVSGNSNFTGVITAASVITGGLQLNGDLNLTHHVIAGGTVPGIVKGTAVGGGGTVSLSGSDTAGSINVNTGTSPPAGCFANITFSTKFSTTPHVIVTPIGSAAAGLTYYLDRSTGGFSICSTTPAPASDTFGFDYIIFS